MVRFLICKKFWNPGNQGCHFHLSNCLHIWRVPGRVAECPGLLASPGTGQLDQMNMLKTTVKFVYCELFGSQRIYTIISANFSVCTIFSDLHLRVKVIESLHFKTVRFLVKMSRDSEKKFTRRLKPPQKIVFRDLHFKVSAYNFNGIFRG